MDKKDLKMLVIILMAGSIAFGGLLAWAEKGNHISHHDVMVGRNVADLKK